MASANFYIFVVFILLFIKLQQYSFFLFIVPSDCKCVEFAFYDSLEPLSLVIIAGLRTIGN